MPLRARFRPLTILGGVLLALALVPALILAGQTVGTDSPAAGNGVYRVYVEDDPAGDGFGAFSIATGPSHPAGEGLSLLSGGNTGQAANSFLTLRSYSTGTDYVQTTSGTASGNLTVGLNEFGSVEPISTTGYRTTFQLPGPTGTPEALRIVSDVNVNGDGYADSAVEITTTVSNMDVIPVRFGLRYLLDLDVAGDDGPVLVADPGGLSPLTTETSFEPPDFATFRAEDNGSTAPTLSLVGTVTGEYPGIAPATTSPDVLKYALWSDAFATAFDYAILGRDIATPTGQDDSSLLYYFGATEKDALTLQPGEMVTVSISLFATLPPVGSEDCSNGEDDDGDRLTDSEDPDCGTSLIPLTPAPTETALPTPAALPPTGGDPATCAPESWSGGVATALLVTGAGAMASGRRAAAKK